MNTFDIKELCILFDKRKKEIIGYIKSLKYENPKWVLYSETGVEITLEGITKMVSFLPLYDREKVYLKIIETISTM